MNIFLWILQILLAAQFLWHGWIMVFPPPELLDIINANVGTWQRIFIGVSEALGALGLILPGLTRTLPRLTVWSAVGLMIVAISASVYHLMRGEISSSIYTAVLFVIILFVAIMRWKVKPTANKEIQ
ncbi:MAG TPA: DoxX family protein [Ignavibacteriaceae bacterium]